MANRRPLTTDGVVRDLVRDLFDKYEDCLPDLYANLTWPQKAKLLDALSAAGDHPSGYRLLGPARRRKGDAA